MKLNAGCYDNIKEGYVNLDKEKYFPEIDVAHDLNKFPYPFKDNTFDEIYSKHCLEHLNANQTELFNELFRITKNNGVLILTVAYGSTWVNYLDHTRGYTFKTFLGLCSDNNPIWLSKGRFKLLGFKQRPYKYSRFIPDKLRRIMSYFIKNLINSIEVQMRVIK